MALESEGSLDLATKEYESLVTAHGASVMGLEAKRRLEMLQKPEAKLFYQKLATYRAVPPSVDLPPLEGGAFPGLPTLPGLPTTPTPPPVPGSTETKAEPPVPTPPVKKPVPGLPVLEVEEVPVPPKKPAGEPAKTEPKAEEKAPAKPAEPEKKEAAEKK